MCLILVETVSFQKGTYLPQTYIIQEEMIATEHVSDMEQLGSFIYRLCSGKETYRLRRRGARRRESPALSCLTPTSQPRFGCFSHAGLFTVRAGFPWGCLP